jgi:hypothetical protein
MNDVLMLAGLVAFAGAGLALWLVREHEIDRATVALDSPGSDREGYASAAA